MVSLDLVLFVVAVVYATVATVSIIRLAGTEEEETQGEDDGPHSYQ